jgi:formylglycine-generating enzyme required for sulfatase activity
MLAVAMLFVSLGAPSAAQSAGSVIRDCADCPEMVVIPAGRFAMGSPATEQGHNDDEGPVREVSVPAFAAGRYEITAEQYDACVAAGACPSVRDDGFGRGSRPVTFVSWNEAQAYVRWLSAKTGKTYRLLSEAEWEFAARAGTTTPFSFGATVSPAQANYNATNAYAGGPTGEWRRMSLPVGSFPANAFGLFDMHGNVREWVEDSYVDVYFRQPADGSAYTMGSGSDRVFRGGSWEKGPHPMRSAYRDSTSPTDRGKDIGFRIARAL